MPEKAPLHVQARQAFLDQTRVPDRAATGGVGASLPAVQLARVLSRGAWRTWVALLTVRDHDAETHVTTRALTARTGLSEHTVKRALARLREAGLVRDLGWEVRFVPCATCPGEPPVHEHSVFVRVVRGALREASGGGFVARVPASTEAWSLAAPAHGGKRPGAGRPRKEAKVEAWFQEGVLEGEGRPVLHPTSELVLVPRFPGPDVVRPAVVPEPPLLDPNAGDDATFATLVQAFRTVHEADLGKDWFRPPAVVRKSRAEVLACAAALCEHSIRPLRWAQWSFGVWKQVAKKPGPPPLAWVWKASRVEEHRAWYLDAWGSYREGRVVLGEVHRDLLARHAKMTAVMRRGVRPVEAVARFFPGDTYDRLVREAQKEADRIRRELVTRVQAGELLD